MKIKLDALIFDLENKEAKDHLGRPLTIRNLCMIALDEVIPNEPPSEMFFRGRLAIRISEAKETINLKSEEIIAIKKSIPLIVKHTILYTKACYILEGTTDGETKDGEEG